MNHKARIWVVGVIVVSSIAALVLLSIFGVKDVERMTGVIEGVLATSVAAAVDSVTSARRARLKADKDDKGK